MKKLILLLLLCTNAIAGDYVFKEYKQNVTSFQYYKYQNAANQTSSIKEFKFKIKDIDFKVYYGDLEELVILSRYDTLESKWKWVVVGDTDQLERDCNAQGGNYDCTALPLYLTEFSNKVTEVLIRDYGDIVIIPSTWKEQLEYLIVNNLQFDESSLTLSFSN